MGGIWNDVTSNELEISHFWIMYGGIWIEALEIIITSLDCAWRYHY